MAIEAHSGVLGGGLVGRCRCRSGGGTILRGVARPLRSLYVSDRGPSQVGRVTLTFMEGPSSDGAAARRPDGVTFRRLGGLAADESAEIRR